MNFDLLCSTCVKHLLAVYVHISLQLAKHGGAVTLKINTSVIHAHIIISTHDF